MVRTWKFYLSLNFQFSWKQYLLGKITETYSKLSKKPEKERNL